MNIGGVYLDKKTFILPVVGLLIIGIACWYMFSTDISDRGTTASEVESNIRSTRTELTGAGQAITNSQSISSEIRRTNQNIEQSNQSIRQSVETSQSINLDSHSLTREGKQILRDISAGN